MKKFLLLPAIVAFVIFLSCDNFKNLNLSQENISAVLGVPSLLVSDDSDVDNDEICVSINLIEPADKTGIAGYYIYWTIQNSENTVLIKKINPETDDLEIILPENTEIPLNASGISTVAFSAEEKFSKAYTVQIYDIYLPLPSAEITADSDPDLNRIFALIHINTILPDDDVEAYKIFWLNAQDTEILLIKEIDARSGDLNIILPKNTLIPQSAVKIAIYSIGRGGIRSMPFLIQIEDFVLLSPDITISPDLDHDEDEISFSIALNKSIRNIETVSRYKIFWCGINGENAVLAAEISNPGMIENFTLPENTVVPSGKTCFSICSVNAAGFESEHVVIDIEDIVIEKISDIKVSTPLSAGGASFFLCEYDGYLYFNGEDFAAPDNGIELWRYNGSDSPEEVCDIRPGSYDSYVSDLCVFNDKLYMRARADDTAYTELFVFDGITVSLVKDIYPGVGYSSAPEFLSVYDNKLFFKAKTGSGEEFFNYDGISDPVRIADIYSGSGSSSPSYLCVYGGRLYFQANDNLGKGRELYYFDGNIHDEKMYVVKDIYADSVSSNPSYMSVFNGKMYFSADSEYHGTELWVLDENDNASEVFDINLGTNSSNPKFMKEYNGRMYFQADNGTTGVEMWCYDGIKEPYFFADINKVSGPGYDNSSVPGNFTEFNGKLYFTAVDETQTNPQNCRKLYNFWIK